MSFTARSGSQKSLPNRSIRLVAALVSLSVATPLFAGGVTLTTNGFESPTFTTTPNANLAGQQGWQESFVGTGLGTATIQTAVKLNGNQALQVNRGANSTERWARPNLTGVPSGRFMLVSWDMRVEQSTGPSGAFGPVFGVETYAANSGSTLLGMLGVDAMTGEVIYQAPGTGFYTAPGATVGLGTWNKYRILLDYMDQQFRMYVGPTFVASGTFVDKGAGNFTTFTDADIIASAGAGDSASQMLTGTAYIDNFVVRDGIAGDFDQDGDIDGADLTAWKAAFGVNGNANSTGPGDNDSDGADIIIWQRELGSFDYTPGVAVGAAVPEPATMTLLGVVLVGAVQAARRRS